MSCFKGILEQGNKYDIREQQNKKHFGEGNKPIYFRGTRKQVQCPGRASRPQSYRKVYP